GDDTIDASAWTGTSVVSAYSGDDTIVGSARADVINPGVGDDVVTGRGGDDTFRFVGGTDVFRGGKGRDLIDAELVGTLTFTLTDTSASSTNAPGTTSLVSIEDADVHGNTSGDLSIDASGWSRGARLVGGSGDDEVYGGAGNDVLSGRVGDDAIAGGGGFDVLEYATSASGTATLTAIQFLDPTWTGVDAFAQIEAGRFFLLSSMTLDATAFDRPLTVEGSPYDDVVMGGSGPDLMRGRGGEDTLTGNGGSDLADGGPEADYCAAEVEQACEQ
ncbi:MAG TPA: hypothetical protein VF044_00695, partial [Actinomycetota bacterium]